MALTTIKAGAIADDAIDSSTFADGSIDNAHLADDAVDGDKLANNIDVAGTLDVTGAAVFDSTGTFAGDLVFSAAGKGVCLGVTSNTDANTLDDYEEGTFTPVWDSTGATITPYTTSDGYQNGNYTKVGKVCHFQIYATSSAALTGTVTNSLYLTGLPFTSPAVSSTAPYFQEVSVGLTWNVNYLTDAKRITAAIRNNTSQIEFYWGFDDSADIIWKAQDLTDSTWMILSGSYVVA